MRTAPLSLALALLLAACDSPRSTPEPLAPAATQRHIGKIAAVQGEGYLWHAGQRINAVAESALEAGDTLETGAAGKIRALLSDDSVLAIGGGTKVDLGDLLLDGGNRSGHINVVLGKFWMQITRWTGAGTSRYEIATPNAVAGVRGTTLWGDTQVDAICALEGTIEVRSLKEKGLAPVALSAGNCAAELSKGKLAPLAPGAEQIERYLDEVLIRP